MKLGITDNKKKSYKYIVPLGKIIMCYTYNNWKWCLYLTFDSAKYLWTRG